MDERETPAKFDLRYSESGVIFSFCDCSLDKKYSFYTLSREEAEKILQRSRHVEKLTWGQFASLPRKNGLTTEKPASGNFSLIHEQNSSEGKLVEQYYFHVRVEQVGLFRIFGYQRRQLFCITHIDPKGKLNHS